MSQIISVAAAPVLTSATPADNTGAVSANANIVLNFSAAVHAGSGTITISDGAMQTYMGRDGLLHTRMVGATDTRTISISDTSQVTISGNQVTINPTGDLKAGLSYSVQMGSGVLLGESGLSYAGLLDATKLNFTTSAATAATPQAYVDSAIYLVDSGSAPDYVTNTANQRVWGSLHGTLAAGETVQVSLDNGGHWHTATIGNEGWYYEETISASNTILARVANSAGGYSAQASQAYVFDTAGPAIASMALSSDAIQGAQTTLLTITFTEKVSGLTLEAFAGHHRNLSDLQTADGGLTWTATVAPGAGIATGGDVMLNTAGVQDRAGNYGADVWTTATFYYDPNPPSLSAGTIHIATDSGSSASDFVTKVASQVVTGSYSGDFHDVRGAKIEVSVNNGASWSQASTDNTTHTWSYEGMLAGSSAIQVRLTDTLGNVSTDTQAYTLDTAAPTLSAIVLGDSTLLANQATSVTITFSEKVAALDSSAFNLEGATLDGFATVDNISWTATLHPTGTLGAGSIALKADAVSDQAGNTGPGSASSGVEFTVAAASALPTALVAGQIAISNDTGAGAGDYVTNHASQIVSGSYSGTLAEGDYVEVSIDNGASWAHASSTGNGSWQLETLFSTAFVDPQDGDGVLLARVANAGGHTTALSHNYTFDIAAPVTTIDIANPDILAGDTTTVTFAFSEAVTDLNAGMFSGDGELSDFTPADGGVVWTATLTPANGLAGSGVIRFTGEVYDLAGNHALPEALIAFNYDTPADPSGPPSLQQFALVLSAGSDTGISSTDGITSDDTPLVKLNLGEASGIQAGQSIEIYDTTQQSVVGSYTVTAFDLDMYGGALSITVDHLADGVHALVARTAASEQYGEASTAVTITVDTAAPSARLTPASLSYSSTSAMRGSVSGGTLSDGLGADGEFVEYTYGGDSSGTSWLRSSAASDTAWSISASHPVTGAPIGLRVSDMAGNLSDSIGSPSSQAFFLGDGSGGSATVYADMVLFSGAGDDDFDMDGSTINYVDGGAGTDTLQVNESLSLNTLIGHMSGIETISLASGVTLSAAAVSSANITSLGLPEYFGHAVLKVDGDSSNHINLASAGWSYINPLDLANTTLLTGLVAALGSLSGMNAYGSADAELILLVGAAINPLSLSA